MKCLFQIANCELHSFSFQPIDSRMYVLISSNRALVVDPCVNEDALQLMKDRSVNEVKVLLTHEHYDHISGVNWIKENINCRVIASEKCAERLPDPKHNASAFFNLLIHFSSINNNAQIEEMNVAPYICSADETFGEHSVFNWEDHKVEIIETPGHSKGSVCIIIDELYVFAGDSLIKEKPIITRLPGGSKKQYEEITLPFLKSLPNSSIIFPGHGEEGYLHEFLKIRD